MKMMKVLKSEYTKKANKWVLEKESVEAQELAAFLRVTKSAITKWRERDSIPKRLIPILEIVLSSDSNFLRRKQARHTHSLFE
jgi:ribosomal protein S8